MDNVEQVAEQERMVAGSLTDGDIPACACRCVAFAGDFLCAGMA